MGAEEDKDEGISALGRKTGTKLGFSGHISPNLLTNIQ